MTSTALCAKAIRQELKERFPKTKFKVWSERYSMGDSVNIFFFNELVTAEEIYKIVGKYQQGHFDSMTDSYEYSNNRDDIPQVKFVMVQKRNHPISR